MRIRRLTPEDATLAVPLLEAQYREHDIAMSGAPLRKALRQLVRGRGAVFVALEPHAVGLAVTSYTLTLEHGGQVAWLDELYVAPERRGAGVGTALLARALAASKRAGCVAMELEVVRGHERAARLYLREGFRKLPRARFSRPL